MKNAYRAIMAILAMMLSWICWAAGGPGTQPTVDAEQAAREYLSKNPTVKWQCGFGDVLQKQNFPSQNEQCNFVLENNKITYMVINGIVVVDVSRGDQPLSGIYPPKDGYLRTNFSIWASGMDSTGQPTMYGSTSYDRLDPGQPISIVLRPQASMRTIPRPADVKPNPYLGIVFPNGGGSGYYDANRDLFVVWVEPFQSTAPSYEIVGLNSGAVLASGTIPFLQGQTPTMNGASAINLATVAGTRQVVFDQWGNCNLQDQTLDGWMYKGEGLPVQCEVYFLNLGEKPLYVQLPRGMLAIAKDGETGELIDYSSPDSGGTPVLELIPGFGKVTITVTGCPNYGTTFWIYFTTNVPVPAVPVPGGGGMG